MDNVGRYIILTIYISLSDIGMVLITKTYKLLQDKTKYCIFMCLLMAFNPLPDMTHSGSRTHRSLALHNHSQIATDGKPIHSNY